MRVANICFSPADERNNDWLSCQTFCYGFSSLQSFSAYTTVAEVIQDAIKTNPLFVTYTVIFTVIIACVVLNFNCTSQIFLHLSQLYITLDYIVKTFLTIIFFILFCACYILLKTTCLLVCYYLW